MANPNRPSIRILTILLLSLIVVGLVGHFIIDMSGHEPLPASGLHAGFVLLSLIAIGGVLTLVTTLLASGPIQRRRFLLLLIQPPISLH